MTANSTELAELCDVDVDSAIPEYRLISKKDKQCYSRMSKDSFVFLNIILDLCRSSGFVVTQAIPSNRAMSMNSQMPTITTISTLLFNKKRISLFYSTLHGPMNVRILPSTTSELANYFMYIHKQDISYIARATSINDQN